MCRFLVLFALLVMAGCAPVERTPIAVTETAPTGTPIPTQTAMPDPTIRVAASPDLGSASGDFPLAKGTTWVYSYDEYEPDPNTPTQITTATYRFVETVVDVQTIAPFFVAHVQHQESLIKADADWAEPEPRRAAEFWYVVQGQQVYKSPQSVDLTNIQPDAMSLAFDLPLTSGKEWCPYVGEQGQKMVNCTYAGRISVGSEQSYSTPAGTFAQCYQLTQNFNSGPINQWFCNGIGIVAEKYAHAGSRFGFQEALLSFSRGSP